MRKNKPFSTVTVNDICENLKCRVKNILLYIDEENIKNPL